MKDTSFAGVTLTPAAGNGSTDDTTAIQDHINIIALVGGGTVYFPIGTYRVDGMITVKRRVNLIGAGSAKVADASKWNQGIDGGVTLLAGPGNTGTILKTEAAAGAAVGLVISNLRFAGTRATTSTSSVIFDSGNFVRVENCAFERGGREAVAWKAAGAFVDNFVDGHFPATSRGVESTGTDVIFSGNSITADMQCFRQVSGHNVIISNNLVYNSGASAGMHIQCERTTVIGNRVDENAGPGIVVSGNGITVSGNTILLNGVNTSLADEHRVGVRVEFGQANAIVGNAFGNWTHGTKVNTQRYGVALVGSVAKTAVTGNTFYLQGAGTILNTSSGTGNVISGNAG